MRAFTQLCEKVNISFYNDTITLYPNKNGMKKNVVRQFEKEGTTQFVLCEKEMKYRETRKLMHLDNELDRLGVSAFIHATDTNHALYHNDDFDQDHVHYHAQFSDTIDEQMLEKILHIFVENSLISFKEKERCLEAFKSASIVEPFVQSPSQFLSLNAVEMLSVGTSIDAGGFVFSNSDNFVVQEQDNDYITIQNQSTAPVVKSDLTNQKSSPIQSSSAFFTTKRKRESDKDNLSSDKIETQGEKERNDTKRFKSFVQFETDIGQTATSALT